MYFVWAQKSENLFPYKSLTGFNIPDGVCLLRGTNLYVNHNSLYCFVGAVAKMRKATVTFFMSLRPSVRVYFRMEGLCSHLTEFHEIWYLSVFRKYLEEVKF
jgi:hypothetical protein